MAKLATQKELRQVRKLPFCYLCGKPLMNRDSTRDHVPPESIFAKKDRNPPLILPVHLSCNEQQSDDDEVIGQLVAVLHKKPAERRLNRLQMKGYKVDESGIPALGVHDTQIEGIIMRWVKGFHAALYSKHLQVDHKWIVHPPFWRASENGKTLNVRPPLPQEAVLVRCMKMNRQAYTIDQVVTCCGKCVYACTWDRLDNGQRICVFGLRLYEWEKLGEKRLPQRGCVGCYCSVDGMPKLATEATQLEFSVQSKTPLDPFGD